MKAYIFLADGFEEIEAVTPIDVLRRAEIETISVSISENKVVNGAHGISFVADKIFAEIEVSADDYLILPGGMPGTANLMAHEGLNALVKKQYDNGKQMAAICAAPSLFGRLGMLEGKEAVCYPSFEKNLTGATISNKTVVKSGSIITGKAPGVAIDFSLAIVETLKNKAAADKVAGDMCFER